MRSIRAVAILLAALVALAPLTVPGAPACTQLGPSSSRALSDAAARVAPAVVTLLTLRQSDEFLLRELEGPLFFQSLAGAQAATARRESERSFASGFVLSADGYIATAAHALHDVQEVWVVLPEGRQVRADIVGYDRRSDVGLVRVPERLTSTAELSEGPGPCAGEVVAAFGSPFGFETSMSAGIVSAYPRTLPGSDAAPLIQTDVAINPGGSGGPLFDMRGRVVGMNSMIYSETGRYMGLSFAVPADKLREVIAQLQRDGAVRHPELGATLQAVGPGLARAFGLEAARGALVSEVRPQGAAALAGLRSGDIVMAAGAHEIAQVSDLDTQLAAVPSGHTVTLHLWRSGGRASVQLVVPPPEPAQRSDGAAAGGETRLGLTFAPVQAGMGGLRVDAVSGSALLAGLDAGDRISAVNGVSVQTGAQFDAAVAAAAGRDTLALLVWRAGTPMYVPVRRIRP